MTKSKKLIYSVFVFATFLKYIPILNQYYPFQDDYIQYHCYSLIENVYDELIIKMGLLNTRPLAGFFDIYIWSKFWGHMYIAFYIITIMHLASAYLIDKIAEQNNIKLPAIFFVLFLLAPLSFEATYWISASSRIIVGLFFGMLSIYFIMKYLTSGKFYILAFALFLSSLLFYEQISVINCICAFIVIMLNLKTINKKQIRNSLLIIFVSSVFVICYYLSFAHYGIYGNRITSNVNQIGFSKLLFLITESIIKQWTLDSYCLINEGLKVAKVYCSNGLGIFFVALITIVSSIIGSAKAEKNSILININIILIGVSIFVFSYIPLLIVGTSFVPYRCDFAGLIGVGLIASGVYCILSELRVVYTTRILVAVTCFLFIFSNIYQAETIKKIVTIDKAIIESIAGNIDVNYSNRIKIKVHEPRSVYINMPEFYKEHMFNITANEWGITGAIRSKLNTNIIDIYFNNLVNNF